MRYLFVANQPVSYIRAIIFSPSGESANLPSHNQGSLLILNIVKMLCHVKPPTVDEYCLFQGKGEWSEGAQTFWQYVVAMLGVAVFLAIQI